MLIHPLGWRYTYLLYTDDTQCTLMYKYFKLKFEGPYQQKNLFQEEHIVHGLKIEFFGGQNRLVRAHGVY